MQKPCSRCGQQVDELRLMLSPSGEICVACSADIESLAVRKKTVWQSILSPPGIALLAGFTLCFPYLNLVLPGALGVLAIWLSYQAFQLSREIQGVEERYGVSGLERALLIASALLAGLLGLLTLGFNLIVLLRFAIN